MKRFLSVVFLFCVLALFVGDVSGHPVCYYTDVGLKTATEEEQCSKSCANYKSESTGRCFAYLFDSQSGECTGFAFDYNVKTNYTKCGANYAAEMDASVVFDQDAFTDNYYADLTIGLLDYGGYCGSYSPDLTGQEDTEGQYTEHDGEEHAENYYAYSNQEEHESYHTAIEDGHETDSSQYGYDDYNPAYAEVDDDKGCKFKTVTLGTASTKKTCKGLCTSLETDSGGKGCRDCVAWFWDPQGKKCAGLVSVEESNDKICSSVEKPR